MKPYWDIMWLRVCDNCDGMLQEVREDSKSRLDLVDTCEICDYDVCNSCRQQIADSLRIQVEGCDPDGACCKAARCLDPEDVGEQRALLIAQWCAYVGLAALVVQTEHGGCA